jgi:hypothetical protein
MSMNHPGHRHPVARYATNFVVTVSVAELPIPSVGQQSSTGCSNYRTAVPLFLNPDVVVDTLGRAGPDGGARSAKFGAYLRSGVVSLPGLSGRDPHTGRPSNSLKSISGQSLCVGRLIVTSRLAWGPPQVVLIPGNLGGLPSRGTGRLGGPTVGLRRAVVR